MKPKELKAILAAHEAYWEGQKKQLLRYKAVYEMNFWDEELTFSNQIKIQTNDGYGYVESFQASLFAKNPAITLKNGVQGKGDAEKSTKIANNFLFQARTEMENSSRMAIIYPMSFIKLVPTDNEDLFDKIIPVAVAPWEIIVDRDAARWDQQRYTGHIYWETIQQAQKRFGTSFKDLGVPIKHFFDSQTQDKEDSSGAVEEAVSPMFQYVRIIEVYDLVNDKLYWYSPSKEDKWLDKEDFIPFRTHSDKPSVPITPFYYNRIPDRPMDGYSSVKRIYDQLYEMNVIRSFQANAVRKASRQWLVKKGAMSEDKMAQVTSGVDGLFIEVESDDALDSLIRPVPHNPVSTEVSRYYQEINDDKSKGSVVAPFTRGEVTKATATEIAALAAYTSSEVGRMARERDAAIEDLARKYLCMLSVFMEENSKPSMVVLENKAEVVTTKDLMGDFHIFASDQASTPMSEAVSQQRLLSNIPALQALGVPPREILKELVRSLGLPESFLTEQPPMPPEGALPGQANQPNLPPDTQGIINNPSVANVANVLPNQGEA
tara:strand:+ start:869 stop:2509 length:1641 start_codon:yes stop_codon:yes gene_type:complete